MPHDSNARRQAAVVPLVLFGEHGRTVEGYMPAHEDLAIARSASADGCRQHVKGPHLRAVRANFAKNKTGIVGISIGRDRARGFTYFWVNLGSSTRRFNITKLGQAEALRRAIALLSAAATNTAKTWDTTAGKDPDSDVNTELVTAADLSGIRPSRVGFSDTSWSKRLLAHRAQNTAGGFASAAMTPNAGHIGDLATRSSRARPSCSLP